ncbi:hypothetical protein GCM10007079_21960 [Nocardiopsis terrae]|uniref:Copper(I)-binding protein n=1 Tax=Nocardiopsis terrae TaxID=372655 RepID=A0ABR9HGU4_9ACTN|nr:copper chaperone PCu(A)C [Nocardiopsis terrae]MBE1458192.1 copper(I)-binding protein [Nocardiopsis terrae]GHC81717.1 hypothetical protein GCM10007079_21960 [Nocardiopsis terrae]
MRTNRTVTAAALAALPLFAAACAVGPDAQSQEHAATDAAEAAGRGSARVGDLLVEDAWMPEPANPEVGVVYLAVTNTATEDDTVTGVRTSASEDADLCETGTTGSGASVMRTVSRIPVPAGGTTTFVDGGYHVMVNDITEPLTVGDGVTVRLTFASGAEVEVDAPVQEMTARSDSGDPGAHDGHH